MASPAPFEAVERRSLSEAVFDQLKSRILGGAFRAGAALPSERALCDMLGVNRGALREALKRLQQLRLISIRQGESTKVLDYRRTGGLELLATMLFDSSGQLSLPVVRSFVEMRGALGPDIARLAAQRRDDGTVATLESIIDTMSQLAPDDAVGLQRQSMELWRTLVQASGNIAYQLAFNTMDHAWKRVQDVVAPTLLAEVGDRAGYEGLVRAIKQQKPKAAKRHAESILAKGAAAMDELIGKLERKGAKRA